LAADSGLCFTYPADNCAAGFAFFLEFLPEFWYFSLSSKKSFGV